MSRNIGILIGKQEEAINNINKIVTNKANGDGTYTWVAESDLIEREFTENGVYEAEDEDANGFSKVTINVAGGAGSLIQKNITENGTYDPNEDGAYGYSQVRVNVSGGSGGGGVAQFHVIYPAGSTITATDGTTTLMSDTSGDYTFSIPNEGTWTVSDGSQSFRQVVTPYTFNFTFHVYFTGYGYDGQSGADGITYNNPDLIGQYSLLLLVLNTEASTFTLATTQTVRVNNRIVTGKTINYQEYNRGSQTSTRNHRLLIYDIELTGNDVITVRSEEPDVSLRPSFAGLSAVLLSRIDSDKIRCPYVRTSDGTRIIDSYTSSGAVLFGFQNNQRRVGTVNCELYEAGDSVDTGTGEVSYGGGYIFFLTF